MTNAEDWFFLGPQKKKLLDVDKTASTINQAETYSQTSHSLTPTSAESSQKSSAEVFQYNPKNDTEMDPTIELHLRRTVSSHSVCCLCNNTKGPFVIVPLDARLQCFNKLKIFIPSKNRVCQKHLIRKKFFEDDLRLVEVHSNTSHLTAKEISLFLSKTSDLASVTFMDKITSYGLSDEQIKSFTGFSYNNLNKLSSMLKSMRNSDNRMKIQALVIFLFKLRTGASNNLISNVFQIDREQSVSDFCNSVLNSFEKDILPLSFGIKSYTREYLIKNHTSIYARKLFNLTNQLVLIFDGTYLRHQKSKNNNYQRKSYSGHKKVPLCKPFTICTTDGFVVDLPGPFLATENDAKIMEKVISNPNGIACIMEPGDVCIVDRGFRDVVSFLEERGLKVLMPALKGKRPHLTVEEANQSRFVTKLRWVVEAIHGILGKKFKLLHNQLDNKLLPKAGLFCKIACFLNNEFGKRLNSDEELHEEILERMLLNINTTENTLASEAESSSWSRRKTLFSKFSSEELLDFPEMTDRDLKIFFSGTYQFGQAISYLAEIMNDDNSLSLEYVKMRPDIIKTLVRSRHINKKTYKCYIQYRPDSVGCSGIVRHTCDCANGLRTVGCCSHVASIVYYLSNARYKSKIIRPAKVLSEIFTNEDIDPIINEDSDED